MENMYSLDCKGFHEMFNTIDKLIDHVVSSGMDPNCEITKNGRPTGECVIDLIVL